VANNGNLKPFKKKDPRINKNGRPKSFDALRTLAQEIAHETAQHNGQDAVINGHKVTRTEIILRQWAISKNPKLQQQFMEVTYGKVPTPVEHTGKDGNAITIRVEYANADTDAT
jgi:hypothetical protein